MTNKEGFREAGFGMMIHFGLYSLLAGEYRGQIWDKQDRETIPHIVIMRFPMTARKRCMRRPAR